MHKKKLLPIFLVIAAIACVPLAYALFSAPAEASGTDVSDLEDIINNSDDPLEDFRQKQEEINKKMDELKEQIKNQEFVIGDYQDQIANIEAEMLTVQQKLDAIQASIDDANNQIVDAEVQIAEAEERMDERKGYLQERLVNLYVYGDISMMDVIFTTENFDDFLILFDMVELVMGQDQDLLNEIIKEKNTIEHNKALMEKMRYDLEVMTYEYEDMKLDLQALQDQKVTAMNSAISTKEGYQAMLDAEEAASEQVTAMLKEWMQNNSDAELSYGGSMIWPLPAQWGVGWITSPYGNRYHPISGSYSFHTGIDIGADGGTPIYAAAAGKIIYKGWLGGYGNTVQISHGDGITTLYGHMSAYSSFEVDDYVVAGDIIGYVGTTGNSTGNHLHFEVRVNGDHTSPNPYLGI